MRHHKSCGCAIGYVKLDPRGRQRSFPRDQPLLRHPCVSHPSQFRQGAGVAVHRHA